MTQSQDVAPRSLMQLAQVAERLGLVEDDLHRATAEVSELCARGSLECFHVEGRTWVTEASVRAYLARG